ncbi:MAG: hypothetical protein MR704_02825 [Clostridia bacterium]|nr:hypothetical protein [Anaerovorax odorimutans]MCI7300688.1 hypothetical protein [Clostridia bacterium]
MKPDFRAISDFRKDNPKAIKGVFRQFVHFCEYEGTKQTNDIGQLTPRVQKAKEIFKANRLETSTIKAMKAVAAS